MVMNANQAMERERRASQLASDAVEGEAGALFWKSSGHPVPPSYFEEVGLVMPAAQRVVERAYIARFMASYRAPEPSAEDMVEMRAAFGAGAEVMNVVTGRKVKL